MKWISSWALFGLLFLQGTAAWGDTPPSIRQPHPLSWMHAHPVGEMPGWNSDFWINFELGAANIWNAPHTMVDTTNGNTLEYFADYEQVSAILELGGALTERLAFSIEIPHAYRAGGAMDSFIDSFHVFIGNRRFNRQFYGRDEYNYFVETNGTEYYTDQEALDGIANVKPKLKYWLWKWEGSKGNCACGLALSAQVKFPVQDEKFAGTTGDTDSYYLLHFGIPLFSDSAIWFTGAYSYLGDNPAMKDWPRLREYTMYEANIDMGIVDGWGINFMFRAESPYLDDEKLRYSDMSSSPEIVARNRASSGWNSLVRWRAANAFGLRYRHSPQSHFNMSIAEDWGIGPYDASDDIYSNGAPDVNFVIQTNISW